MKRNVVKMALYKANGGQTYIPTSGNINVPLVKCEPLPRPKPLFPEPILKQDFIDKGYVASGWHQQFLPGVEPEALDWFWANMEKCYYLWAPGCHKSFEWVKSPVEHGFVSSVHKISESMGMGLMPMGEEGITLHRFNLDVFPFSYHLEHIIIEGILNDKGEIFNIGVHMWEKTDGGCVHISRGATNTKISERPKFVIDFKKAESDVKSQNINNNTVMPHPEYEAAQWVVFLPKLYNIWKNHPDPFQNVSCDLRVRENEDGKLVYLSDNPPVKGGKSL
jgi:hypothetical protein